jgi:hypothetical protein
MTNGKPTDTQRIDAQMDKMLSSREFPPVPANRLKQIEAALITDLKPVRPLASDGAYLAAFAGIFIVVCIVGVYILGQQGWRALSELQKIAVFLPLGAITAVLAWSIVRQMTPAAKYARSSALVSGTLFILLLIIMAAIFHPAQETGFIQTALNCFRTGMTYAIPAALFFALLLLRGAALSPALIGATAGGLAGLVGLTVLELQCPNLNLYHIVVGHVSVTLICVLLGVVLSSVILRNAGHRIINQSGG